MIVSSRFSRFSPNFHSGIIRIETMTRTNEIIRRSCFRIDSSPPGDSRHTFFPQKYAQMIGKMVFFSRRIAGKISSFVFLLENVCPVYSFVLRWYLSELEIRKMSLGLVKIFFPSREARFWNGRFREYGTFKNFQFIREWKIILKIHLTVLHFLFRGKKNCWEKYLFPNCSIRCIRKQIRN